MKLKEISNKGLIAEILRPILAEFYPNLEPFTLDEVKQLLKERTGKEVEDVESWVDWYMKVYQVEHNDKESLVVLKNLYDIRKKVNAKMIKLGLKPLDE